jgi:hypothetical protein
VKTSFDSYPRLHLLLCTSRRAHAFMIKYFGLAFVESRPLPSKKTSI